MNELEQALQGLELQLLGYAGAERIQTVMGALAKTTPANQAAVLKRVANIQQAGGANLSRRDHAMMRIDALPADIQKALATKRLQLVDDTIYTVKVANAVSSVEMFKSDDDKSHGVSNVAKAQLDKDQFFLITGIRVTSGIDADKLNAAYGIIAKAIANGDFEFTINGGQAVLPKDTATSCFDTTNKTTGRNGEISLDNPKWIEPGTDIKFNLTFSQASVANTNIKVELIGVRVVKV